MAAVVVALEVKAIQLVALFGFATNEFHVSPFKMTTGYSVTLTSIDHFTDLYTARLPVRFFLRCGPGSPFTGKSFPTAYQFLRLADPKLTRRLREATPLFKLPLAASPRCGAPESNWNLWEYPSLALCH